MKFTRRNRILAAVLFELTLALAGVSLAEWLGVPIGPRMKWSAAVAWQCVWATLPMLGLLIVLTRSQSPPLVRLHQQVQALVGELFGRAAAWELALVALAAGVGEELLFRGALQSIVERWTSPFVGLLVASLVFGAAHAASATYFILAALVGGYLGWLAQRFNNLTTPIFVHAAYDFAALVWLLRKRPNTWA